jgi:hypothetical protein
MACKKERWMCLFAALCVVSALAFSQEAVPPEESLTDAGQTEAGGETGEAAPDEGEFSREDILGGVNIIEQTESGFRISQRLNWAGDEFAGRYEVIIELLEEGGYREVLRRPTTEPFIEVSLSPGKYRYKVLVYNLLGRVDHEMDWSILDVIRAMPPALTRLNPESFLLDKEEQGEVILSGRNLIAESDVFLVFLDDGKEKDRIIRPLAWLPDPSGERARMVLDKKNLPPGRYAVHVRNPGNLEVSLDTLKVAYYRLLDVNLMAGYVPIAPLYGQMFSLTDGTVYPLGALARLSVNPMARQNIAFELEPFFYTAWPYKFPGAVSGGDTLVFTGFKAYGLYRKPFAGDRVVFNLRIGGGLLYMFGQYNTNPEYTDNETVVFSSLVPVISGGISFQFMITKSLFVEAGISYTHGIIKEEGEEETIAPGYIEPLLGVGWRF